MTTPSLAYRATPKGGWARGEGSIGQRAVFGIDPGGTTGWAIFCWPEESLKLDGPPLLGSIGYWTCGQLEGDEDGQVDALIKMAEAWPTAEVVVEDFRLRQMAGGRDLLAPVRVTAAFKHALRWTGENAAPSKGRIKRTPHFQMPSLAMSAVDDDRLKRSGFWDCTKGKPHARDAIRHCLTFARRAKQGYFVD